jgi:hypothetical protein
MGVDPPPRLPRNEDDVEGYGCLLIVGVAFITACMFVYMSWVLL